MTSELQIYAFFMSGRAWDRRREIEGPFGEAEPPTTDEVTLAELGLRPGQRFLYIFDFGGDLRHEVEVLGVFSPPPAEQLPWIVESHGKAPGRSTPIEAQLTFPPTTSSPTA